MKRIIGLASLLWLTASMFTATGQTAGTILGTLTDQSNAVLPNVSLTITEQGTGASRTVSTNEAGLFRAPNLLPGRYTLRVGASGFKSLEMSDISLASSETRDLGSLALQLGSLAEEVAVTAQATPVQTSSSERGALIDGNQLNDVALKGRDSFGFMRLIPGVVDTSTDRSLAGPGAAGTININGMGAGAKNDTLDGVSQVDQGGTNIPYVSPNLDSISEVKVLTGSFQAEFGRNSGGVIQMVTKSGTKEFHGSAFWNRRHESMNANSFFNNRSGIDRPIYRFFIGGYSVGGPVYIPGKLNTGKDRLFFFVSQEFTKVAQPTAVSIATLPTALERGGDFSKTLNTAGRVITITDPNTAAPFPGNVIPKTRIDPTGLGMLNLFLLPNGYVNPAPGQAFTANFKASAIPNFNRRNSIYRGDWAVTDRMLIYGRYGQDINDYTINFLASPGVGPGVRGMPGYNWAGHVINTFTPSLVNDLTIGVGHNNLIVERRGEEKDEFYFRTSSLNPPTLRPFPTGTGYKPFLPGATYSGGALPNPGAFYAGWSGNAGNAGGSVSVGTGFPFPYLNFSDNLSVQDDVTKIVGSHSIKMGGYYERSSKIETSSGFQYPGLFNFGSNVNNPLDTGHGYANALVGVFQTYTEDSNRAFPNVLWNDYEFYVQDSWKVKRSFTLDYGMRFYHMPGTYDNAKVFSNFYPELWDPKQAPRIYRPATVGGRTVAQDPLTGATTFAALQNTLVPGSGNPVNGMRVNGFTGNNDYYSTPFLVLSPRLGFAWDVFGDGRTAVRGSFGVYYNHPQGGLPGRGAAPVIFQPVVYYSPITQIPQAASSAAISPTSGTSIYGDQKMERNHQFNLTIQRDIGHGTVVDIAYVGNFNRHAPGTQELNPIPEFAYANPANLFNGTALNPNQLRTRFPGMGSVTYTNYAVSNVNYHALQLSAQHRMSRGLQFGATYMFSKSLGTLGQDPYHSSRQWYYGPNAYDRSQVANFNWTYKPPSFSNNRVVRATLNNWTISGIASIQTGAPITPTCTSVSSGIANSDPSLSGVTARCKVIGDPKNFVHDFYNNFNTSAFTLASPGTYGNSGLGILRQPSYYNIDTTVEKRIPVGERRAFRLRLEAYNVLNHTEFNTIGSALQLSGTTNLSTTWGQYTATNPSRVMSTTIRFEF